MSIRQPQRGASQLSEQLAESQKRYDDTKRLAEARRARLASASHDLQQPLLSLRRSLAAIGKAGSEEHERARAAIDFLESVTGQGLGLHLVRTACAEQGIGFEVISRPGEGASFRLSIARQ